MPSVKQTELDTDLIPSGRGDSCLPEVTDWVKIPCRIVTVQTQNRLEVVSEDYAYVQTASYAGALVNYNVSWAG